VPIQHQFFFSFIYFNETLPLGYNEFGAVLFKFVVEPFYF